MKKLIPFLLFSSTALYSTINPLPVTAMGCNSHYDKSELICKEGDKNCEKRKSEEIDIWSDDDTHTWILRINCGGFK